MPFQNKLYKLASKINPFINKLVYGSPASVLIYVLISFFSCLSQSYPSHTSLRGDFLRAGGTHPRDRRLGLAWVSRYDDPSCQSSFVLYFRFKNAPFLCLSSYPSRNYLFSVRPPGGIHLRNHCPVAFRSLYFCDIFDGQLAGGAPLRGPSNIEWAGGARPRG